MFAASEAGLNPGASCLMRAQCRHKERIMTKKGEINLQKQKHWKTILVDFERSGLSGASYCRQKGLSYRVFAKRRRNLSRATPASKDRTNAKDVVAVSTQSTSAKQVEFAEVTIKTKTPTQPTAANVERLEVVFRTGTVLRVPSGYSAAALAEIVTALEV